MKYTQVMMGVLILALLGFVVIAVMTAGYHTPAAQPSMPPTLIATSTATTTLIPSLTETVTPTGTASPTVTETSTLTPTLVIPTLDIEPDQGG